MEKTELTIAAIRYFCIALALLLLGGVSVAHAETAFGGAIVANTTWSVAQGPYLVTSDVSVESGALLTIEAGVTVRFQSGRRLIIHNGALRAAGTAAAPVTFTSSLDIPSGTPTAGDWGGIQFLEGTVDAATSMDFLTVSYGSTTAIYGASPTFNNCRFEHNSGYALSIDLASYPHGSGNSASGNGVNAIRVPAGEMLTSGAWDFTAIPYYLDGVVSVGAAPTLSGISPSTLEQGSSVAAVISGTRLGGAKALVFADPAVTGAIQSGGTATSLPVQLTASAGATLGQVGFSLSLSAGDISSVSGIIVIPPTPHISSITPDWAYVSRAGTISITGTNFTADSAAYLSGTPLATTLVNATQLTAALPAQLIAEVKQIQVKTPDPRATGSYLSSENASFTVELPQFALTPAALPLRQGESGTVTLTIPYAAPAGGITANLTSTNTASATVPATATIAEGTTSTTITVTAPDTVNSHDVILEVHANQNNWLGNKATVTVRPEPTVNLSPTSILSGQGYSFFLTVTSTDPAPAGGLTVDLAADTPNIVSIPASVTIAAGFNQEQVTVLNTGTGNTVISGTPAVGSGFSSGDNCAVSVKPVQTHTINPLVSQEVGVQVGAGAAPVIPPTPVAALVSRPVGVVSGPIITGMTPNHAPLGTQNLLVRIKGSGFATDSTIFISPSQGPTTPLYDVTVGVDTLVIASDGSYIEFRMNISEGAQVSDRIITVTSGGKTVPPATVEANHFKVTWPPPELLSLIPNNGVKGTTFTLQINGHNLLNTSSISIEPPDGISISNSISISTDGSLVSVPITIDAAAASGKRVVIISTPGGTTTASMNISNSFSVWQEAGTPYTPLGSNQVGVFVTPPTPPTSPGNTSAPLASQPVGVAVGPVITGISPSSGAIGSTISVRLTGRNLTDVQTIEFNGATYSVAAGTTSDTGLSVTPGSLSVAADGSYVDAEITITPSASLTPRIVLLKTATQTIPPAFSGANIFWVTLPQPMLAGIMPIQREVSSSFTLSLSGSILNGATLVAFDPPEGITVVNPPVVSSDGKVATVSVNIAANAPATPRTVTISTPGGTTTSVPSAANRFTVTEIAGTSYTPVVSHQVGVLVTPSTGTKPDNNYGPIVSPEVGVYVEPAAAATPPDKNYGPVISAPVGVVVGSAVYSMTPARLEPGSTVTVTFTGIGLELVSQLSIRPSVGVTAGTPVASTDGTSMTVYITADPTVSREPRILLPMTATAAISVPVTGINLLYVGDKPAITNIVPNSEIVGGSAFTLTIVGTNLGGSNAVRFEPSDGVIVINPPVVNAAGTQATVTIIIEGTAPGGDRVVVIDGSYGASSSIGNATNIFKVLRELIGLAPSSNKLSGNYSLSPKQYIPVAGLTDLPDPAELLDLTVRTLFGLLSSRTGLLPQKTSQIPGIDKQNTVTDSILHSSEDCLPLQVIANMNRGYRGPPGHTETVQTT